MIRAEPRPSDCLAGGGAMGALMRATDWSATPLGAVEEWPQSLRTTISIMLESKFAMVVAWGREYRFFYNDRYQPILGGKHPAALGTPGAEIFPEVWGIVGPEFDRAWHGEAFAVDDWLLPLARNGYLESCWFTLSYSPIRDESGGVGGVLAVVVETTGRVEGERRLATLRDLARRAGEAQASDKACQTAAEVFAQNPIDVPFALVYLMEPDGTALRRVASVGLPPDHAASVDRVVLGRDRSDEGGWPLSTVLATGAMRVVDDLDLRFGGCPGGMWPEPADTAVLYPLARPGAERPFGVVVAGVSPRRQLDDAYRGFFELAAEHITTALSNAHAFEAARRRAEALAEVDRAKTTFFSNVSHEFRTPLTLLLGPIDDVLKRGSLSSDDRESIGIAQRNAQRLLKLVNTLLDFSRIEAGRVDASYEPTDLAAFTSELASVFRSAIENAGLSFLVNCPSLPEPVYVDREMWEKIVLNLLSNALKFTFEGEIEIALVAGEGGVDLRVRDTGVGIPSSELRNLFARFHRIRGSRSRTHEGTGIGLALVKELARLHGGQVEAESEEGAGTTFTAHIPFGYAHLPSDQLRVAAAVSSTGTSSPVYLPDIDTLIPRYSANNVVEAAGEGASGHVLFVDDNADMREYVSGLLRPHWPVETAVNGSDALDRMRARSPEVVLADVMMPGMNGFELLSEIRRDPGLADIPVILLSARAGEESKVEGLDAGADDYLIKPFSAAELIARVRSHLLLARQRRESIEREHQLRRDLEVANRAKDEFLTTLSHELRTPMTATLGWASMLRIDRRWDGNLQQAAEAIEQSTRAQARLIDDILDVSRISTGKMQLSLAPVSLDEVVKEAVSTIRRLADEKSQTIEINMSKLDGSVSADADRLGQVIRNLLSNAVKFTPAAGRIRVDVEEVSGNKACVRVADSGEGMSSEFLPFVFDRFRQADAGLRRAHGGLGLGLSIVRNLTELHGGTVTAESAGVGKGSTFTVTLPLVKGDDASKQVHPEAGPPRVVALDGIAVLVVEDDPSTRVMLQTVLGGLGASVLAAASAPEAMKILGDRRCVVISDIAMPGEDGYSFIGRLRDVHSGSPRLPTIALTANARAEDRDRALDAGFDSFLAKPIDIHCLAREIRRLAGEASLPLVG